MRFRILFLDRKGQSAPLFAQALWQKGDSVHDYGSVVKSLYCPPGAVPAQSLDQISDEVWLKLESLPEEEQRNYLEAALRQLTEGEVSTAQRVTDAQIRTYTQGRPLYLQILAHALALSSSLRIETSAELLDCWLQHLETIWSKRCQGANLDYQKIREDFLDCLLLVTLSRGLKKQDLKKVVSKLGRDALLAGGDSLLRVIVDCLGTRGEDLIRPLEPDLIAERLLIDRQKSESEFSSGPRDGFSQVLTVVSEDYPDAFVRSWLLFHRLQIEDDFLFRFLVEPERIGTFIQVLEAVSYTHLTLPTKA